MSFSPPRQSLLIKTVWSVSGYSLLAVWIASKLVSISRYTYATRQSGSTARLMKADPSRSTVIALVAPHDLDALLIW
jgi:hypothetical protein